MTAWVMDWLYPTLTALFVVLGILMLLTWRYIDRQAIILWLASLMIAHSLGLGLLSIVSGENPAFSINDLRPWIVASRVLMFIIVIPCIVLQFQRLRE